MCQGFRSLTCAGRDPVVGLCAALLWQGAVTPKQLRPPNFWWPSFENMPSSPRRFPAPWSVGRIGKEHVRLAPGCRYEFEMLSAASPTAVFKDIVLDKLARTECRQT